MNRADAVNDTEFEPNFEIDDRIDDEIDNMVDDALSDSDFELDEVEVTNDIRTELI